VSALRFDGGRDKNCGGEIMNEEGFLKLMEEVDAKLTKKGIPVYARFFHAYSIISKITGNEGPINEIPGVDFSPFVGPNLANAINNWYKNRWGKKYYFDTTIGIIPMIISGEVFISNIPLVFGGPVPIPIFKTIDDITEDLVQSLPEKEIAEIRDVFQKGCNLIYEFYKLKNLIQSPKLKQNIKTLALNSVEDCKKAVTCLANSLDTNGSRFHSQQLAEKIMKLYLMIVANYSENEVKKLQHDLCKILKNCMDIDDSFNNISKEIMSLSRIKMKIRYTDPKTPLIIAHEDFWCALTVAGFCMNKIQNHYLN
jgi:hypothetical protein